MQVGLDVVGMIPGVGTIANGANAVISLARGDYAGAALSALAMVPGVGTAVKGTKLAVTGIKAVKSLAAVQKVTSVVNKGVDAGKNLIKSGSDFLGSLFKKTEKITGTKPAASSSLNNGLGTYSSQGGHHVMAQSAFRNTPGYNAGPATTVSNSQLDSFGVRHSTITGQQKTQYTAYAKTEQPLTMDTMRNIEINAMTNSGVPRDYAVNAVDKEIARLADAGISQPSRIPWG